MNFCVLQNNSKEEPIPPKFLRMHLCKLKQMNINNQQVLGVKDQNQLIKRRIVTEIDHQLNQTYNKIKQQQSKKSNQSMSNDYSVLKKQELNQNIFKGLKYETVKQYVRYVYMNYNIPDPLEKINPCSTPKNKLESPKRKIPKSKKKIQILKNNFYQQLNSGSILNDSKIQNTTPCTQRTISAKLNTQVSQFTLRDSYQKDFIKLNSRYTKNIQKNDYVKQQFRYCFMCQQAILTINIQFHQKTCDLLKRAYHLNSNQLFEVIKNKIKNIKDKIKLQFLTKEKQYLSSTLFQIQDKLKQTMQEQKTYLIDQELHNHEIISQQIQKSKILKIFQLQSRLKWFLYLQKNLQIKVKSQQQQFQLKNKIKLRQNNNSLLHR